MENKRRKKICEHNIISNNILLNEKYFFKLVIQVRASTMQPNNAMSACAVSA